jgi:NAD kinase
MDKDAKNNLIKESPAEHEKSQFGLHPEKFKEAEKTEIQLKEEADIKEELQQELAKMNLDDNLKAAAEQKAKKIQVLGDDEKIQHLLNLVKQKGVIFAIGVAKSMNDPYILDIFHDILVKEGLYKKI